MIDHTSDELVKLAYNEGFRSGLEKALSIISEIREKLVNPSCATCEATAAIKTILLKLWDEANKTIGDNQSIT